MSKAFIVGFGDIGHRLAALYRNRGVAVSALTRRLEQVGTTRLGVELLFGDLDRPETLTGLPTAGALLCYFAPPPPSGETDPRVGHLLRAIETGLPQRVVYISTSGVYGDRQGAWVDESTPPAPDTGRARRRLDAERQWQAWGTAHDVPIAILRVGGIYGPGRLPVARLRRGEPTLREAECGFTNRIHADDLVTTLVAAGERGQGVYNVSDDEPGTMSGYFKAVARRLGLPPPPEIPMETARRELSAAMLSYLLESRRMDSRRLREELGVVLRYPNLAAGLAAIDPTTERQRS